VAAPEAQDLRTASLEDENRRLRRAVRELSVLNDLASAIGASLDSEHIVNTIISRCLRAVRAEQGVITLVDRQGDRDMRTLVRTSAGVQGQRSLHVEEAILGWMLINKKPLLLNDPRSDERFRGVRWDESVRSLLCVPLLVKSELTGVLAVFNKRGSWGFNEDDQRVLSILASQSAQVVETARLYEKEQSLRRIQEELRLAREIQQRLLPKAPPEVPGYDIAAASWPAETVGGDYFDLIVQEGGGLAVCLGDVSGKGLLAAMLMANLQATIRTQALMRASPERCLEHSNRLLWQSTEPHKFVTLFYGILDTESGDLRYSNAGHDRPLLLSDRGRLTCLEEGGLVLGFVESTQYREGVVRMTPGSMLVVYSDGVTDATNEHDEEFGVERLKRVLVESAGESAASVSEAVLEAVRGHAAAAEQSDDITLVVLKRVRE